MEQSHSPSDVLSGLRENPSALMSARLSVKWTPPLPRPPLLTPAHPQWTVMLERSGLQLTARGGERRAAASGTGGRFLFFLWPLERATGEQRCGGGAAAVAPLIRRSDSAE